MARTPMATARLYERVAAILKAAHRAEFIDPTGLAAIAGVFAITFERDNPRFKREKFFLACGLAAVPVVTAGMQRRLEQMVKGALV